MPAGADTVFMQEDVKVEKQGEVTLPPGLKRGGIVNVVRHEIDLICDVDSIPDRIVVNLAGLDINLHYLASWRDVLLVAREHGYFPDDALNEIESFIADPIVWSAAHGGADRPKA